MTGKELVKQLQKKGWEIERTNGSHYIMKKGNRTEIVPYQRLKTWIASLNQEKDGA